MAPLTTGRELTAFSSAPPGDVVPLGLSQGGHLTPPGPGPGGPTGPLGGIRRGVAAAIALSAVVYVGYGVWTGLGETGAALVAFHWPTYGLVLLTTLGNYALRYLKWVYLLSRIGARLPHGPNLGIFAIGLSMTLSPGKAGELVKPWLVREASGIPLARTVPVLVAERLTDALAVLGLAAVGAAAHAADQVGWLLGTLAAVGIGVAAVAWLPLEARVFAAMSRWPGVGRLVPRFQEILTALRACLTPASLLATLGLSGAAWWLECVGTWLVLRGFGVDAGLSTATFVYAFATALGAVSPGGVGVADAALVEGTRRLLPGADGGIALAAAFLVRVATLWFGVILGAVALLFVDRITGPHPTPSRSG